MAHLWSKFTKCLRPSEGAFDPGLCHPRALPPSSAQCRVIRYYYIVAITTSRKQRGLHLFIYCVLFASRSPFLFPYFPSSSLSLFFSLSLTTYTCLSFISLFLSLFATVARSRVSFFHNFPSRPETPDLNEYNALITKYHPSKLSIFPRHAAPSFIYERLRRREARSAKDAG